MKGIVLAGGKGTRLYPLTHAISKQLLPVYKYPMIYFPICTLRDMGIKDILIITTPEQQQMFKDALAHVTEVNLSYAAQDAPRGLAEAFIIAEEWLAGHNATLILGDNIIINNKKLYTSPNTIFTYKVKHPERYGVVVKNEHGLIDKLVEKPKEFISEDAVIGLYIVNNNAPIFAKHVQPSARGELEIVDLIRDMNEDDLFFVEELDGFWFDAGTHDDLLDCANMVRAIEQRTNRTFDLK